MADSFIFTFWISRSARRFVGFFSWLCFSDADWLGRQTQVTWFVSYLMSLLLKKGSAWSGMSMPIHSSGLLGHASSWLPQSSSSGWSDRVMSWAKNWPHDIVMCVSLVSVSFVSWKTSWLISRTFGSPLSLGESTPLSYCASSKRANGLTALPWLISQRLLQKPFNVRNLKREQNRRKPRPKRHLSIASGLKSGESVGRLVVLCNTASGTNTPNSIRMGAILRGEARSNEMDASQWQTKTCPILLRDGYVKS